VIWINLSGKAFAGEFIPDFGSGMDAV